MCDDAVLGIELALADVEFTDGRLVHRLLTRELQRAVTRTFSGAGYEATDVPADPGAPVASSGELPLDDVVGIEIGEQNPEEKAQRKAGWFDGCFACDCSGCCCDCDGCCECDGCCCDGCCDCCDCS